MPVFKAYFMVARYSKRTILLSLGIFAFSFIFTMTNALKQEAQLFEFSRTPIAVVNLDEEGILAHGLENYLRETSNVVTLPHTRESLQDALFYRRVEYVAIIEKGFSEAFMHGLDPVIHKVTAPGSTSSHYVDLQINRFLNTIKLFSETSNGQSQEEVVAKANHILTSESKIRLNYLEHPEDPDPMINFYFRNLAYPLSALIISGISATMLAFNRPNLYMRNLATPLPRKRRNLQLLAGHGVYAFGCWFIFISLSIIYYGPELLKLGLIHLYALNSLAFTFVCISLGFLLGDNTKSYNSQAGAVQIISWGMTLLGGVTVDLNFMSQSVLTVAKFLPTYWYVVANGAISDLLVSPASISPIWQGILIQLGFAIAIILVTLFLRKERIIR